MVHWEQVLFPFKGGAFVDLNGNTVSNSFELQGIGPGGGGALRNTNTGTGPLSMRVL